MASGKGCRAVFLDRDGVINEVVFRNGKPASPRTLEEFRFCEGLEDALHRLSDAGLRLFIISNQPEIARGLLTPAVLEEITKKILASLPVERVLVCPHDDADDCACRSRSRVSSAQLRRPTALICRSPFSSAIPGKTFRPASMEDARPFFSSGLITRILEPILSLIIWHRR